MADVFSVRKRSEVMSRIRGRGNESTELVLMQVMRRHRVTGWRRNSQLPGRPDFYFPIRRLAVFVDGCFWHGCPKHYNRPATNPRFWATKLQTNKGRDREVRRLLRKKGIRVLRIWEHDLTAEPGILTAVRRIGEALSPAGH